jgi:octopine/nopaline transport system permease protein
VDFGLAQLVWDAGWGVAILRGALVTTAVGILGMTLGMAIGFTLALVKWARVPVLTFLVDAYVTVVRCVPGLLIVYLLFFGSSEFVAGVGSFFGYQDAFQNAFAFLAGVAAIGLIAAAYATEVFRGALAAIHKGQIEAARALALPRRQLYSRIIGPQMLRYALPGISNLWQATIKDTSLVSVTGLAEVMRIAYVGAGSTKQPLLFFAIAALVFFAITLASQGLFELAERRLNRGVRVG